MMLLRHWRKISAESFWVRRKRLRSILQKRVRQHYIDLHRRWMKRRWRSAARIPGLSLPTGWMPQRHWHYLTGVFWKRSTIPQQRIWPVFYGTVSESLPRETCSGRSPGHRSIVSRKTDAPFSATTTMPFCRWWTELLPARPDLRTRRGTAMWEHWNGMENVWLWHFWPVGGRIIRPINGVTAESCLDMDWKILFTGSSERKNFPDGNSTLCRSRWRRHRMRNWQEKCSWRWNWIRRRKERKACLCAQTRKWRFSTGKRKNWRHR